MRPSRHWIPLIGAFSGMRLGEICQLRADDFVVQDGIDVILIRDDGDRHLKTASARRIVPVHGQLVRLGLLEYVQGLKPDQRLFPDLRESASGYLSDIVSRQFSDFLRRIGVAGSFHGFRHLVTDQLRDQLVSRDQINALLGWSGKGMAETVYGKGFGAKVLAKAIAKIKYEGLDLSRLHN
jgi:integrase